MPDDFARYLEIEHLRAPPATLYEDSVGTNVLERFTDRLAAAGIQSGMSAKGMNEPPNMISGNTTMIAISPPERADDENS